MIVVFVIDTSPSMGKPLVECTNDDNNRDSSSMSRLDLAKMAVEEVARRLKKRIHEHNLHLQQLPHKLQESFHNIGLGFPRKMNICSCRRLHNFSHNLEPQYAGQVVDFWWDTIITQEIMR